MELETKSSLDTATIETLQQLIRANIDSYDGLLEAAEEINDGAVAVLFRRLAAERSENASELQLYVNWNGQAAEEDGTTAAAVRRAWMKIRSIVSGGNSHAILAEAERGENHIKQAYVDALKQTVGSAMNNVLLRQYVRVKAGHDEIRMLQNRVQPTG